MKFLHNAWYAAGWADDVDVGKLVAKTFLNQRVVMFRDSQGAIKGLQDRCPHRFVPLHLGELKGDTIQCAYHGLVFDCTGACVLNPHGNGAIPKAARVRRYPMAELYGLIWIWMGDEAKADPQLIGDFSEMDPVRKYVGKSYLSVNANYVLENDNIMDLSHIEFLHKASLGSSKVSEGKIDVVQVGDTVHSKRSTVGEKLTAALEKMRGIPAGQLVDRWLDVRWNAPASMLLTTGYTFTGRPKEEGRELFVTHLFTPETESTTHYWFGIAFPRSMGLEGEKLAEQNVQWLIQPFSEEDMPMLEAQQQEIGDRDFWSLNPVLLPSDGGAVRARRVLDRLIKEEQEALMVSVAQSGTGVG
ncbi:vanillate monooxygenase [Pseudomonas fluorescens]|nr:vanillate monooxygenase [Pseudomonas fluorescens]